MITVDQIHYLFAHLPKPLFDIPGWFIAGGAATSINSNDVDIYFTTETSYLAVQTLFTSLYREPFETPNALSYATPNFRQVQLIHRQFSPIPEILADFDLNVCRKAILPSGQLFTLPESNHPLYLDLTNIRSNSISRYLKYLSRGFISSHTQFEALVHHLISTSDTIAPGYYDGNECSHQMLLTQLYHNPYTAPVVACIVDSYPPTQRLDIYSYLISPIGSYAPDPSLSHDHQFLTSSSPYCLKHATPLVHSSNPELFL